MRNCYKFLNSETDVGFLSKMSWKRNPSVINLLLVDLCLSHSLCVDRPLRDVRAVPNITIFTRQRQGQLECKTLLIDGKALGS